MSTTYYLNFKINTNVLLADGQSISTGAVVSFLPHDNAITPDNKLPCDLRWWASETAQTNGYSQITVCTDADRKNKLVNAYLPVLVPVQQFTYTIFQTWAKTFLEGIYGVGNITILN